MHERVALRCGRFGRRHEHRPGVIGGTGWAILLVAVLVGHATVALGTDRCGSVCNETWTLAGSPYIATCDLDVPAGCSLTVQAGVEARFDPDTGGGLNSLKINGALSVSGTEAQPVEFSSNAASPAAGDWTGIEMLAGSSSTVEHAAIVHAVVGVSVRGSAVGDLSQIAITEASQGVIVANSASGTFSDIDIAQVTTGVIVRDTALAEFRDMTVTQATTAVEVRGSSEASLFGVKLHSNLAGLKVLTDSVGSPTVRASACEFVDNGTYGIGVFPGFSGGNPVVTVSASSIHSNAGSYDFETIAGAWSDPAGTIFWAPDCWWGTLDHALVRSRILDHEDDTGRPKVVTRHFGETCEFALGEDRDLDGHGDFEDNCPARVNNSQADADLDTMGDACDPQPAASPVSPCDGLNDFADGYADSDGDGWGDPCDFQPTRADSYPGAPEVCDGRDNDGDAVIPAAELTDQDLDEGVVCGDCDDTDPQRHACACEACANSVDDDCDGFTDAADSNCDLHPYCVLLTPGGSGPELHVVKAACSGGSLSGPFDVIRGFVLDLASAAGSVDLGPVDCVSGDLAWDRATDLSPDPGPSCEEARSFYLAKDSPDSDFGGSSSGEPRDVTSPDPACP